MHQYDALGAKWGSAHVPSVEQDYVDLLLSPEDLASVLPTSAERQKLLARDPLSCVEGFRMLCRLALRHLFGLRSCPFCPECNSDRFSGVVCQDVFGSSAEPEGCIFGRVDAIYGSIENQKAGVLHMHMQVFVQCLHQHTPLKEVMEKMAGSAEPILEGYLRYKSHVSATSYDDLPKWTLEREGIESQWPVNADDLHLVSRPAYMTSARAPGAGPASAEDSGGEAWLRAYRRDAQEVQQRKQHHVHLPMETDPSSRRPLTHC